MGLFTAIRKLRYPQNTDQFNPPADFQRLASDVDAHLFPWRETAADLPGTDNWDGRLMYVKDVDALYRFLAGPGWGALRYFPNEIAPSGYAIGAPWTIQAASRIIKAGPEVLLQMNFASSAGGVSTGVVFGSVPASVRPTNNQYVTFYITSGVGRGIGLAEISATNGAVTMLYMSDTGGTFIRFNCSYRLD